MICFQIILYMRITLSRLYVNVDRTEQMQRRTIWFNILTCNFCWPVLPVHTFWAQIWWCSLESPADLSQWLPDPFLSLETNSKTSWTLQVQYKCSSLLILICRPKIWWDCWWAILCIRQIQRFLQYHVYLEVHKRQGQLQS